MILTVKDSHALPARDHNKFPTVQLALLSLVRISEPIAICSIFPYAWKLVLSFNIGDRASASFYAGLLIASYSFAESLTSVYWGIASDKVGRKPILLFGCASTALTLLIVGFANNFWVALLGRVLGGLLNGNMGVIQTVVGELVTNPDHEPKAFAVMPVVWSLGSIIGPVIGGCFAEPVSTFPSLFSKNGVFSHYPFLLPNLICAGILLLAVLVGIFMIEETHPEMQHGGMREKRKSATTPLISTVGAKDHAPADLRNESYGTFNIVNIDGHDGNSKERSNIRGKRCIFSRRVLMLIAALGIFTYHSICFDHLLPIYLQDERGDFQSDFVSRSKFGAAMSGGLGISIQQSGVIMAVNGIIALVIQAVVFPAMAQWLGIWKLFLVVVLGHPIVYFIVPFLSFAPKGTGMFAAIYSCLTIRDFFSMLEYPAVLILIKEASSDPRELGVINGLAASTSAATRTIGSPVAGYLYGVGTTIGFTPLAWWASGAVAGIGAAQVLFMRRRRAENTYIESAISFTGAERENMNADYEHQRHHE